uniref:SBP-type domain-containing protein n=2 Tax=Phaseolus vulgaris TaxID=3885 RepID=V7CMH9_PHAVU|nr:hypothetical protein PHAVU_002G230300g [Phaseolus vulgaris]ESW31339.1 hypothetical protein PHAVU_002G230300g [Phaseolus vulgaris]
METKRRPYVVLTNFSHILFTLLVFTIYIKYLWSSLPYVTPESFFLTTFFWISEEFMDASRSEGKRVLRYNEEEEEDEEEEEEEEVETGFGEEGRRNKRVMTDLYGKKGSKAGGSMPPSCQVDNCDADLSEAKQYHRRHKVCEYHAKVHSVLMAGLQQRFCQQCSRFHELSEFDESKRSCRTRLVGHNERRRKNAVDCRGE